MAVPRHHIRPIAADDKQALVRFHARLSPETRYRRYHAAKHELTRAELRYLTEVDGLWHVAAVAVDEAGEIDAVARVVGDEDGGFAEVAVVVADDRRRLGLGRRVTLSALDAFAVAAPAAAVTALIQPDNRPALRLFTELGGRRGVAAPGDPVPVVIGGRP